MANGISRSGLPPRNCVACSFRRWSSLITSRSTCTELTPGTLLTAPLTSRVIVSRIGQPENGQVDLNPDRAADADLDVLDHAEFGDGAADLRIGDACQCLHDVLHGWSGGGHVSMLVAGRS